MIQGRLNDAGLLVVPVEIDGVKLDALVDTGAAISVVSGAAAQVLGWAEDDPRIKAAGVMRGAAGQGAAVQSAVVGHLAVGPVTFRDLNLFFSAQGGPSTADSSPPTFILGSDLLNNLEAFAVDFPKAQLLIRIDREVRLLVSGGDIHQEIPGSVGLSDALNNPQAATPSNITLNYQRNMQSVRTTVQTRWRLDESTVFEGAIDLLHPDNPAAGRARRLDCLIHCVCRRGCERLGVGDVFLHRRYLGIVMKTVISIPLNGTPHWLSHLTVEEDGGCLLIEIVKTNGRSVGEARLSGKQWQQIKDLLV